MFKNLENIILNKLQLLEFAEEKLEAIQQQDDPISIIQSIIKGKEYVIFCGAGISISGASYAPGFLDLRNNILFTIAKKLVKEGVLNKYQEDEIIKAIDKLAINKLTYTPEMVFSHIRYCLGNGVLKNILNCLDEGTPNENHYGIVQLAKDLNNKLKGVITTNFDTYIENAFAELPYIVYTQNDLIKSTFFPILKPHGCIKKVESIRVSFEDLHNPPKEPTLSNIKDLLQNRIVLVIGYSGMDYDIFPLLINAGKNWNTEIVWILYNNTSINSQIGRILLSISDKCKIINGDSKNILAELAGLKFQENMRTRPNLVPSFTKAISNCSLLDLIHSFSQLIGPINIAEKVKEEISYQLLDTQLREIVKCKSQADNSVLYKLLQIVEYSQNKPIIRKSAIGLGKELSKLMSGCKWLRQFEYYDNINYQDNEYDRELKDCEFNLTEKFFPHLDTYSDYNKENFYRFMRKRTIRRKAELLIYKELYKDAEEMIREMLCTERFPNSGLSEEVAIFEESSEEGKLYSLLAEILIERGENSEAEKYLCHALEILWKEMDTFELDRVINLSRELFNGNFNKRNAIQLAIGVAKIAGIVTDEFENRIIKLESGFANEKDLEETKLMLVLNSDTFEAVFELKEFEDINERIAYGVKTWFRNGKAVFLERML